jgi:hypothetical protein
MGSPAALGFGENAKTRGLWADDRIIGFKILRASWRKRRRWLRKTPSREAARNLLAALVEPLLIVRRALREQIVILHRRLLAIVRDDEMFRHMARESAQRILRLAGRRRDRVPLALVAEMQERHEHKREGGEGRR